MNLMNLFLSVGVIGGADGPTTVAVSGLPLPAMTLVAVVIILLIYTYASKVMRNKKAASAPQQTSAAATAPAVAPVTVQSGVELINTDEKTAAVIMAIVSDKSGIPLNKLAFKSIKLMEDK